jgi:hypothetical protein
VVLQEELVHQGSSSRVLTQVLQDGVLCASMAAAATRVRAMTDSTNSYWWHNRFYVTAAQLHSAAAGFNRDLSSAYASSPPGCTSYLNHAAYDVEICMVLIRPTDSLRHACRTCDRANGNHPSEAAVSLAQHFTTGACTAVLVLQLCCFCRHQLQCSFTAVMRLCRASGICNGTAPTPAMSRAGRNTRCHRLALLKNRQLGILSAWQCLDYAEQPRAPA